MTTFTAWYQGLCRKHYREWSSKTGLGWSHACQQAIGHVPGSPTLDDVARIHFWILERLREMDGATDASHQLNRGAQAPNQS